MATTQSTQKSATQKSGAKEPASNMQLPADVLEGVYTTMCRIRRFDEMTHKLFDEGHVKGTAHSYVGQETRRSRLRDGRIGRDRETVSPAPRPQSSVPDTGTDRRS